jgi:hypothetical protein
VKVAVPILTYHSMHISGNAYGENDLVALASDLETIASAGYRIEPLVRIVEALVTGDSAFFQKQIIGLSCDDGPDFDFHDLDHPTAGPQRSVLNILRDHGARYQGHPPTSRAS